MYDFLFTVLYQLGTGNFKNDVAWLCKGFMRTCYQICYNVSVSKSEVLGEAEELEWVCCLYMQ